jgi:hypothetical protein
MAKNQYEKMVSPAGIAVWPYLNSPDTKFDNGGAGEYKVSVKLTEDAAQPVIDKLQKILDQYQAEEISQNPKVKQFTPRLPIEEEVDDQGNLTGNWLLKVKQKAQITTANGIVDMKVALFDAKRRPTNAEIGGGSTLKVATTIVPYTMPSNKAVGISLRLNAVQVINLVEGGSEGDGSMFDVEDGFSDETSELASNFTKNISHLSTTGDTDF